MSTAYTSRVVDDTGEKYKLRETLKSLSSRLERAELLLDESARGAAVLPQILNELSRLRVELVSAATKSDHVPISALVSMSRIYNGVIKTLAVVTVVIVMWLTGVRTLIPELNMPKKIESGVHFRPLKFQHNGENPCRLKTETSTS